MSDIKGDQKKRKEYKYTGLDIDQARKHDKSFKGPIENRSCTDIICCVVFLIFIAGLVALSFWAYSFGDIRKLIHPTNSRGEICGVTERVKNRPNLVFFNLFTCVKMGPALLAFGCPTKQICVKNCPTSFWMKMMTDDRRNNTVCVGDKDATDIRYKDEKIDYLLNNQLCAEYVFPSIPILGRCVPDFSKVIDSLKEIDPNKKALGMNSTEMTNQITQYHTLFAAAEIGSKILNDIIHSYVYIAIGFLITVLLSFIYLFVLRFFAGCVVWITIILFVLMFAIGTGLCFFTYYLIVGNQDLKKQLTWFKTTSYDNSKFWLGMGIAMGIIFLLILLILIFLRNRIRIAISILKVTSKSLVHMMSMFVLPIVTFVLQVIVIGGSVMLILQLSTIKSPQGVNKDVGNLSHLNASDLREELKNMLQKIPCTPGGNTTGEKICTFIKYSTKEYIWVCMVFVLFMFFWLINFVKALSQMTIAGSFASYYFAFRKPQDIPVFPVISSFWRAIRYHLGSLAFGSLIIAIVQLIRAILEYLDQKAKESRNILAQIIMKCLKCCFWCLEKFLKFLNKNAYIMIAIYGQNFCTSARNAFNLILRNIVRVVVLDNVTNFVLFMGKLVIVGAVGSLSFVFFNHMILKELSPKLFYFYVPIIIIIIGSYIITTMFFEIYDMGADTIFLCFCEDLERNDGSPEKPYFMNKELLSILGKSNNDIELKV